jgi:heme/copper-type cytochrome/quinol oxidase subunit 2
MLCPDAVVCQAAMDIQNSIARTFRGYTMASIFLMVALIFSPIAAAMAFLIVYDEYRLHFPERKTPLKMALRAALATLIFFIIWLFFLSILSIFSYLTMITFPGSPLTAGYRQVIYKINKGMGSSQNRLRRLMTPIREI